jgi:hypothetical protein
MSGSLIPGGVVSGSITASQRTQEYVFSEPAGARVRFQTLSSATPNFRAVFTVYDSAGRLIWTGTGGSAAFNLAGGQYTMVVGDEFAGSVGNFSIRLDALSPVSPDHGVLINGGLTSGSITAPLQAKEYVFTVAPGTRARFVSYEKGFGASFTLFTPEGYALAAWSGLPDGNGHGTAPFQLTAGGQYMLEVTAGDNVSTGTFSTSLTES